ncbi:MAG: hypothetical protein M1820_001093 [Bogoriella megaspora]|nr:MAG: hypothetical protein M1820_001093 [Bogoriella megaspora]
MAQAVGKLAAKKLLSSQMKQYSGKDVAGDKDPYFAYVETSSGRKKKVKKQVPSYIPEHDALILAKVRKRAYRYDMALFNFLGIRFGWSAVIGLIPYLGDFADVAMAYSTYRLCNKVECGLDKGTKTKMKLWITADGLIGLVPLIGDLGDAALKCNTQNLRLLEIRLDEVYMPDELKKARGMKIKGESKSEKKNRLSRHPPATVFEDFSDEEHQRQEFINERDDPPPQYSSARNQESAKQRKSKPKKRGGLVDY